MLVALYFQDGCPAPDIMTLVEWGRREGSRYVCLFYFKKTEIFIDVPASRLSIIFHWPELDLMVSRGCKGEWKSGKWAGHDQLRSFVIDCLRLETLVHGSKSGICYQARRDGMNSGSTMNKACHKWFYSTIKPIVCSHSLRTAITLSYYVPLILCDIQKCCLMEEFCQELAPFFFFSTHTIPQ